MGLALGSGAGPLRLHLCPEAGNSPPLLEAGGRAEMGGGLGPLETPTSERRQERRWSPPTAQSQGEGHTTTPSAVVKASRREGRETVGPWRML